MLLSVTLACNCTHILMKGSDILTALVGNNRLLFYNWIEGLKFFNWRQGQLKYILRQMQKYIWEHYLRMLLKWQCKNLQSVFDAVWNTASLFFFFFFFFFLWRAPQQMLRTHRSLKAYCATLWWRWSWAVFYQVLQVMEHQWNAIDRGKPTTRGKTCPSATLSTTNLTWTDPASNSGLRSGSPATNRLSHGAALLRPC
jgi:hypothetical protein